MYHINLIFNKIVTLIMVFVISSACKRNLCMKIAPFKQPRINNAPGNLFVDESCIDCDVCRWMCPDIYSRKGIKSIVHTQPISEV